MQMSVNTGGRDLLRIHSVFVSFLQTHLDFLGKHCWLIRAAEEENISRMSESSGGRKRVTRHKNNKTTKEQTNNHSFIHICDKRLMELYVCVCVCTGCNYSFVSEALYTVKRTVTTLIHTHPHAQTHIHTWISHWTVCSLRQAIWLVGDFTTETLSISKTAGGGNTQSVNHLTHTHSSLLNRTAGVIWKYNPDNSVDLSHTHTKTQTQTHRHTYTPTHACTRTHTDT